MQTMSKPSFVPDRKHQRVISKVTPQSCIHDNIPYTPTSPFVGVMSISISSTSVAIHEYEYLFRTTKYVALSYTNTKTPESLF